jgi:hypothetical protein
MYYANLISHQQPIRIHGNNSISKVKGNFKRNLAQGSLTNGGK